jgi:hypothetical protein
MKHVAVVLAVAVLGVVGFHELAEMTRNEDDVRAAGTVSEVVIDVHTRRIDDTVGAEALWAACHTMVAFADTVTPLTHVDDAQHPHRYRVRVTPALGENDRRRLRGCLEDGTVDRVWGDSVSITPGTE